MALITSDCAALSFYVYYDAELASYQNLQVLAPFRPVFLKRPATIIIAYPHLLSLSSSAPAPPPPKKTAQPIPLRSFLWSSPALPRGSTPESHLVSGAGALSLRARQTDLGERAGWPEKDAREEAGGRTRRPGLYHRDVATWASCHAAERRSHDGTAGQMDCRACEIRPAVWWLHGRGCGDRSKIKFLRVRPHSRLPPASRSSTRHTKILGHADDTDNNNRVVHLSVPKLSN